MEDSTNLVYELWNFYLKFQKCNCKEPNFCHPEADLWDIYFKLFIKKQKTQNLWASPILFSAQEIQTGKPALEREPWLNHPKNLHPSVHQEDSTPIS